jgi:hypothetical protein
MPPLVKAKRDYDHLGERDLLYHGCVATALSNGLKGNGSINKTKDKDVTI